MRSPVRILALLGLAAFGLALSVGPLRAQVEDSYLSKKRVIRITDGIGRGTDQNAAVEAAIANARLKALERVASAFVHSYERTEDFQLTEDRVMQDIHAKILKTRLRKTEFPFENVALVTVDFTVEYFDLDFFVREIRKSAESAMVRSLVISGWGQVYNRNYFNALLCFASTYGSLATAWTYSLKTLDLKDAYKAADARYAPLLYDRYKDASLQTAAWLSIGIGSWAYSMWEAFEDREITALKLKDVNREFFPGFDYPYKRSFVENAMDGAAPRW